MNEKIKELIDWCQTEIDFCIDIMNPEHGYNSYHTHRAEAKKQVLDVVKDKLCSIYEDDKLKCKGYVYTEKGKFEITEIEGDEVYYRDENGVERAFHER